MEINGIAIPITFPYSFRGEQVETIEVFFAHKPLDLMEVDIIDGATSLAKRLAKVLKYGEHKAPFCLIPLDSVSIDKYEAPWGLKIGLPPIGSNPTTATKHEQIPFLPVKPEIAPSLLKKMSSPFYLSVQAEGLTLHVKKGDSAEFYSVPSQPVGPECWPGFAHEQIQLINEKGSRSVPEYEKLPWADLVFRV